MRDRRILGLVIAGVLMFVALGTWYYQSRTPKLAALPQPTTAAVGTATGAVPASMQQDPEVVGTTLMMAARNLSDEEHAALEERLNANPDDVDARQQLLAYHWCQRSFQRSQSQESKAAHERHALWLIEHAPESPVTGSRIASVGFLNGDTYTKARALWQQHLEAQPDNPRILARAAECFTFHDRQTAIDLYKRGEQLEPDNPMWSRKLAQTLMLGASPREAFDASERALAKTTGMERFYMLSQAAKTAFTAGEIDTARRHATELLDMSMEAEQDWNYGNAVHFGNLILGRIALADGNVDAAESHLLRAGKTPGSPQLNSFGPNMTLAKELLEAGRTKAVLEYLDLCAVFWKRPEIQKWKSQIDAGKTPSFGANLVY